MLCFNIIPITKASACKYANYKFLSGKTSVYTRVLRSNMHQKACTLSRTTSCNQYKCAVVLKRKDTEQ